MDHKGHDMRYTLVFLMLLSSLGITGCNSNEGPRQLNDSSRATLLSAADYTISTPINAENSLAMAANSASQSLATIASYDQALNPTVVPADDIDPHSSGLDGVQTINWIGSAPLLLKQICPTIGYQCNVIGKPSALEPTITIDAKAEPVLNILRNIKFQLHQNHVEMMIDPDHRVIELQYTSV